MNVRWGERNKGVLMISKCLLLVSLGFGTLGSIVAAENLTDLLSFVPITPCRIIDTRPGAGFSGLYGPPALSAGAVRTFPITGTTTGTPTQCGIPDEAEAISANFTAVLFTGAGDIRAFPAGGAVPLASILNYRLETIANTVTVPMRATGGGHNGISLQADVHSTHVVVDVSGYYAAKHLAAFVVPNGTLSRGLHAISSQRFGTGQYGVVFDRDIRNCFWLGAPSDPGDGQIAPAMVYATLLSGPDYPKGLYVKTCCDVAGQNIDNYFVVSVTCP
jgi:hypothetical protein